MKHRRFLGFIITTCVLLIIGCKSNNTDWRNTKYSEIKSITCSYSSFEASSNQVIIDFANKSVRVYDYSYNHSDSIMRRALSDDEIHNLLNACMNSKILSWKDEYIDKNILDGTQGVVTITMDDETVRRTYFSNRRPRKYTYFDEAIGEIINKGNFIEIYSSEDIKMLNISSKEDVEGISDETLVSIAVSNLKSEQNIADYNSPENFGVYFTEDESWRRGFINCYEGKIDINNISINNDIYKDAIKYMSNLADDLDIDDFEIMYCGETDEYIEYSFRYTEYKSLYVNDVYTTHELPRGHRIVFLKDEYKCDYENRSVFVILGDLSTDRVKRMIDLVLFLRNANNDEELIYRDVEETTESFVYTYYSYSVIHGDYGINDSVILNKSAIILDKKTHEYSFLDAITIKEVEVDEYIFD